MLKNQLLNIYLKIKAAVALDFWNMLQFSKSHEELEYVTSLINFSLLLRPLKLVVSNQADD